MLGSSVRGWAVRTQWSPGAEMVITDSRLQGERNKDKGFMTPGMELLVEVS